MTLFLNQETIKCCVAAVCLTAGYVTYVALTKADGLLFGAFTTALGILAGVAIGKVGTK